MMYVTPRLRPSSHRRRPGGPVRRRRQALARGGRLEHRHLVAATPRRDPCASSSPAAPGSSAAPMVERLARRGDDVVALVRDTGQSPPSRSRGPASSLVASDLSSVPQLTAQMKRRRRRHPRRRHVPRSASSRRERTPCGTPTWARPSASSMLRSPPGVKRIVYVSTVNVFGNTRGEVVRRDRIRRDREARLSSRTTTRPSTAPTRQPRSG